MDYYRGSGGGGMCAIPWPYGPLRPITDGAVSDPKAIEIKIQCDAKTATADLNELTEAAKRATDALDALNSAMGRFAQNAAAAAKPPQEQGVWAEDITGKRTFVPHRKPG